MSVPYLNRAPLDRNMTINASAFRVAVNECDLSGLAILDLGCGEGRLTRLLRNTKADVIYAFEVMPEHIAPDIRAWAADQNAKPRLVINPPALKIKGDIADGDLTNYDYFKLLSTHKRFGIIGNPPYFLYNRVLSLTGGNLAHGSEEYASLAPKFAGALMITSKSRLHNHPGWQIKGIMGPECFNPPPFNDQYIVGTGLCAKFNAAAAINLPTPAQKYVRITDRVPYTDMTDNYPEMWDQLNTLPKARPAAA